MNDYEEYSPITVIKSAVVGIPTKSRGLSGASCPNVEFPEFTAPRQKPSGFNPADHVETRVVRLYYFRDAHRVAQIINRDAKSCNRQAVDMAQQMADRARRDADGATDARRRAEQQAVIAAQKARAAEQEQQRLQQAVANFARDAHNLSAQAAQREQNPPIDPATNQPMDVSQEVAGLRANADNAAQSANAFAQRIQQNAVNIEQLRNAEAQANGVLLQAQQVEERARADQFQREVAAAHADPDTYAPGKVNSNDPVRQVSVSVIGEGLIQLRGPMKGINIIRKMIHEIDAPVGQVRIAVHTVQINGEHGDRMEKVATEIQQYLDHSRFLTMQSAEMLRRSVASVAAQQAEEARMLYPGDTQESRDRRYLYAFFGQDFIDELFAMNSEFLHSGNKLLSLHSMNTTSLANAMFLLALAKNSTRMQILHRFEELTGGELPMIEQSYLEAGQGGCVEKHSKWSQPQYALFAENTRFETLRGFFRGEIMGDETLSPVQREFIRLAQIFKARMITEMEYEQRVRERALIETRLSNEAKKQQDAEAKERKVEDDLRKVQLAVREQTVALSVGLNTLTSVIWQLALERRTSWENKHWIKNQSVQQDFFDAMQNISAVLDATASASVSWSGMTNEQTAAKTKQITHEALAAIELSITKMVSLLAENRHGSIREAFQIWIEIRSRVLYLIELWEKRKEPRDNENDGGNCDDSDRLMQGCQEAKRSLEEVNEKFDAVFKSEVEMRFALEDAQNFRQPLDQKKFLDMFIVVFQPKWDSRQVSQGGLFCGGHNP